MFCPVCKAEYRSGFTSCSDCGIDLVEVAPRVEQRFAAIRADAPAEYDELLVRSKDPGFYLSLLATLSNCRISCYGKAVNPVAAGAGYADAAPEFEIWIHKEQRRLAVWVRDSSQEDYAASSNDDREDEAATPESEKDSNPQKVCVLCSAEYSREATLCENCGTGLVWSNQRIGKSELARSIFREAQPQMLGALRTRLLEEGIPFNNGLLYRDGLLRNNSSASPLEVVVREVDFERATRVLAHLLEGYEFEPNSRLLPIVDPTITYWPHRADHQRWLPEGLTALAWTGHNFFRFSGTAMALREHEIPYRAEAEDPKNAKLYVHPDDEADVREIVRMLLEGPDD
jgi:ribosomal protein L40E